MFANVGLYVVVGILLTTLIDTLPLRRYRRQAHQHSKQNLPYEGWSGGANNPSGAASGAYYGTGINPNYGHIGQDNKYPSAAGIRPIIYNDHFHNPQPSSNPQQQLQYYLSGINNGYQQQSGNNNNYYQPYNRYAPGSAGWYAVGGNYWYNAGRSLVAYPWLLIVYIVVVFIYK